MRAREQGIPAPEQQDAQIKKYILGPSLWKQGEKGRQARPQQNDERLAVHNLPLCALLDTARWRKEEEAGAHEHDEAILHVVGSRNGLQNEGVEVGGAANVRQKRLGLGLERVDGN